MELDKYTDHIKDPDKLIKMRRILDKVKIVKKNHSVESTDFLDPFERSLAKSILNRFTDINFIEYGGFSQSERKVISIFPAYYDEDSIDHGINSLRITDISQDLNHRDFLGAILKLGIIRDKIGDILVHEDYGFVILKSETKDFILFHLEKIGNENIKIEEISMDQIIYKEPNYRQVKGFLNSLRLDLVLSNVLKVSRSESSKIINSNKVKVNWEAMDKVSKELEIGDVVSVKGFGRFTIYSLEGHSKKGKLNIIIRILI